MKKLLVTSDAGKNRSYFTVSGKVSKKELNSFYTEVRFSVEGLKPGFSVISDFSDCQLVFLNIIPTFRNIMRYLVTNMVGEMIGIMNKNSLFYKQLQLASMFQEYTLPVFVLSLHTSFLFYSAVVENIPQTVTAYNNSEYHL